MLHRKLLTISKHLSKQHGFKNGETASAFLCRCQSTQSSAPQVKPSYIHYIGKKPLVYRNVGQELERAVAEFGSTEAIVSYHEGKRHSFRTLLDEVDRVAAGFLKLGLKLGDNVGIYGPNNLHWYLTMLGAIRAGLVTVGINPAFQGPEVEYCLKKVKVKAIVAAETFKTQNYYEILQGICPELAESEVGKLRSKNLPHLQAVIIDTKSKLNGVLSFDEFLSLSSPDEIPNIQKYIQPDSPCNIQFTSGTTGQPKAAVLSHFNWVNNAHYIGLRNQLRGERICVQVPLFHAYGTVIIIMAAISHAATLVLPSAGFNPEASLHAIVNEKCTITSGTPTMYVDLIKKQKELKLPLKTTKIAISGGAPCSPQLFEDMMNVLGVQEVRSVFGLTETTASVFQSRAGDSLHQMLNTVGHVHDHIEAKIIDEQGNTVPIGQPGELCVRGYNTMLGYYEDEAKTQETIGADKWLKTGDQFVLQEDGYGRIVGRLKDMVIRGGENIFPKEVEDFLNTHPEIIETHVVGVPCERLGEDLCAFVRLHDGVTEMTNEILKAYCKGKLAHYKVPRYVIVVKDFPKTTSGKIQKFKLKLLYEQLQQ